jgi:hypothetical protein
LLKVPLWPSEFLTTTFTAPAVWLGVFAVIELLLTTVTFVAADPPKLTVAPEAKFVPVIVTPVPPPADPEFGDTDVTVGAGLPPPEPFNRTKLATDGTPLLLIKNSM